MNFQVDLNTLILAGIGALITWVLNGITGIKKDLRQLNNRTAKMETWQSAHEKFEDDRINLLRIGLSSVWDAMSKLKERDKGE